MSEIKINAICTLSGFVADEPHIHKRIVKIKPVEHRYEESGEKPYIKYGCPICETFDNKHTVIYGSKQCHLCGINFFWQE